ncbi:hypothetical protein ES703_105379 [subsurface metagenome]
MVNKAVKHLPDIKGFRPVINQSNIGDGKGGLQGGVTVNLVQGDFAISISFQVRNNPQPVAVGLIPDIGNFGNLAALNTLRNFGDNRGLDDHIGYFGDYYFCPAPLPLARGKKGGCFDTCFAPDCQMPPAGGVSIHNSLFAANDTARWEIRAGQPLDNILESTVGLFNDQQQDIANLSNIVRRQCGGHTDGNAGRAINQQIRKL